MLKIKLSRTGKKHQPHYRVIVAEAKSKRDGKFVANLGYYIPYSDPAQLKLNLDEYNNWLQKGAQPTQTVRQLALKLNSSELTMLPKSKSAK